MSPKRRKIVLMGSGELTATMVEVHKRLLDQSPGSPHTAFLDTPAGFQLNVDQISQKAVEYFRGHVQHAMAVFSFKEAEFIHSDIAAARKPKWFLLGTEGAIAGYRRDVTSHEFDPDFYYQRHDIPVTEMVPELTIYRRHYTGDVIRMKPAIPDRDYYRFHSNLADHLLLGEPIVAPLDDSVKVVAILDTAARSMAHGGTMEILNGRSD